LNLLSKELNILKEILDKKLQIKLSNILINHSRFLAQEQKTNFGTKDFEHLL
jgi:hypothetical protein